MGPCSFDDLKTVDREACQQSGLLASFFSGVRIRLGMIFNYLILWVRVKGQG